MNFNLWRCDFCVGTVHLPPEEVPGLITGLTERAHPVGPAAGTRADDRGVGDDSRLRELERRLAELEARSRPSPRGAPRGAASHRLAAHDRAVAG